MRNDIHWLEEASHIMISDKTRHYERAIDNLRIAVEQNCAEDQELLNSIRDKHRR